MGGGKVHQNEVCIHANLQHAIPPPVPGRAPHTVAIITSAWGGRAAGSPPASWPPERLLSSLLKEVQGVVARRRIVPKATFIPAFTISATGATGGQLQVGHRAVYGADFLPGQQAHPPRSGKCGGRQRDGTSNTRTGPFQNQSPRFSSVNRVMDLSNVFALSPTPPPQPGRLASGNA